ncbi:MAG: alanyl-tRNA editing protein, partial [Gammaproteobacteria bacterium]
MTERLYEQDSYLKAADARVVAVSEDGIVLDRTVFYARGGGQPGDQGELVLSSGAVVPIVDTVKGETGQIIHLVDGESEQLPAAGDEVLARIDWERRHRHMRMHTCMHLLCALVDAPVTGGNLNDQK